LGSNPPSQNMQLQNAAATWRIQTRNWVDLPERFRFLPNYFGPCYEGHVKLLYNDDDDDDDANVLLLSAGDRPTRSRCPIHRRRLRSPQAERQNVVGIAVVIVSISSIGNNSIFVEHVRKDVKSSLSHKAQDGELLSVSLALSQTPVYTATPLILGQCIARCTCLRFRFRSTYFAYPRRDGQAELTWRRLL